MENNPEIIKRLVFIKSFFQFAQSQSKLSFPHNYISILMFHDSVELFLYLSAEQLNVNLPHYIHFMEYWEKINNKLNGKELTQKVSMSRLNTARTSLKHKGNYPNPDDIEYFRVSTQNFFEENCPIIFGIEFVDISLIDLIRDDEVKKALRDAENESKNKNYKKSLENIAIAFHILLENYEKNKKVYGISPFDIGNDLEFEMAFANNRHTDNEILNKLSKTIQKIQKVLKLIILDLDYRKYLKFKLLTPYIVMIEKDDKSSTMWFAGRDKRDFKKEDVEYCIKFVIESTFKLYEFDFEIDEDSFFHSFFT